MWTCSITGRPGLTYQEALDSEERARKQLAAFPDSLQKPILYLSTLTQRSRLNDLNDDVFVFARDRYFIGETVEVLMGTDKYVNTTEQFVTKHNFCNINIFTVYAAVCYTAVDNM